jgi:glycosyltransferase involved in cell wall biosynthesis
MESARIDARRASVREDVDLLDAREAIHEGDPEVSVVLATHDRLPVLLECLESLCRQALPRGGFEILVMDDGSTDGTAEVLESLDLPVPWTWRRLPARGAAVARNAAIPLARGRLVLWVNDDTVALPGLLRRHLEAHARLRPHRTVVLGTFEQTPEARANALVRHLDASTEVFLDPTFRPGSVLDGQHLYTCNASMPIEAVREIGGFDETFPRCLGEDTDLGVRLERKGWRTRSAGLTHRGSPAGQKSCHVNT